MPEPHRTATGIITESPLVLVDAITTEGVTGHGIVFTYTATALRPTAELIENIAPLVEGKPLAPLQISDELAARFRLLGTQGLVGMALAGIDMALWDAQAKVHGVSLTRLLGGEAKPLQAYGAIGHDGWRESAIVAENWAKRGFRGVKAKIGYPTLREDLEVIRAIRAAVGEDVAIMVDYNQCLTPAEAIARITALDETGLTWVEEPTLAHDFEGHAAIARAVRTPIQCGENWWGPLDLRHAIHAGASDFVMPEVMKIGGVTGWRRAVAMAEAHGLRVSNHLWPEVSAQLLATTPLAHWLEYADWWNPILTHPLQIDGGFALPCTTAGSGIAWNEAAVSHFSA
ncbi:MAG: Mandelate racemase/muconate lactonizing enzyme C-terminal domain protein [Bryobacterales bacterium]|nr:Mandelate racemase/muconate lactonizing enzyme C-terminal domain protein [Bryobacterales bacterium]